MIHRRAQARAADSASFSISSEMHSTRSPGGILPLDRRLFAPETPDVPNVCADAKDDEDGCWN